MDSCLCRNDKPRHKMSEMIATNEAQIAVDFTATDTEGKTITLSAYKGQKNVALVFNRGFF